MVAVRINGSESGVSLGRLEKVAEMIELIKGSIDPEHMITSIRVDGRELDDADWTGNLSQYGTAIFEIDTDTPANFVGSRFLKAPEVIQEMYYEFREARKGFQAGEMVEGNQKLISAVNTARAFFDWYGSLLPLVPEADRSKYDINPQVAEIAEICKRICTQQLYQSWWALGETLEKDLEPKLDQLQDFCKGMRKHLQ